MLETILVPIDIAGEAEIGPTLEVARNMAQTYKGKITLLHVVASVPGYVAAHIPKGAHEKIAVDARARLEQIAGKAKLPESTEILIREGSAATEILECAREIGAKLIIINSHDPGFADYFIGSTAARVVRHAHCSVLVTRFI